MYTREYVYERVHRAYVYERVYIFIWTALSREDETRHGYRMTPYTTN